MNAGTGQRLSVSLSHRAGYVVFAISPEAVSLGVDIEPVDQPGLWNPGLIDLAFTADEQRLLDCNNSQLLTACWTIKEAAMKAQGDGIPDSLHDVQIRELSLPDSRVAVFNTVGAGWHELHVVTFVEAFDPDSAQNFAISLTACQADVSQQRILDVNVKPSRMNAEVPPSRALINVNSSLDEWSAEPTVNSLLRKQPTASAQ